MEKYYMPTKIIWGSNCINNNKALLEPLGKKAFIVTGRSSEKNGSLNDMLTALSSLGIHNAVFNETEENPSVECVQKAADKARRECCDFVAAIGGGSPLDAGKAVAVLLDNPDKTGYDLYSNEQLSASPFVAVPTTAGTGSEATGVFVLTNHRMKTKSSTPQRVYPQIAFMDGKYLKGMPDEIMMSTVSDSLAHSIESYLSASADFFSERAAEGAVLAFGKVKDAILKREFTDELLNELLLISTLSGIAINQTGTSLPHFLGYSLTYRKNIPHGRATGVLLYEYMSSFKNKDKINTLLSLLNFKTLSDFGCFMRSILSVHEEISADEIKEYTEFAMSKPDKLKTFPENPSYELLESIYTNSLRRFNNE